MTEPNILVYDIETAPNVADVWGLWNQNVGISQIREAQRVICWGAQWLGTDETLFMSEYEHGYESMLQGLYELLSLADIVITYNGVKFDNPHMNTEFVKLGWTPPANFQNIDLLKAVKKKFRFPSNKLDYVASVLLGERKVSHEGHDLWTKCLMTPVTPDEIRVKADAWARMEEYCRYDVELTGRLYYPLRPWIDGHPNMQLFDEPEEYADGEVPLDRCPTCKSDNKVKEGFAYTNLSKKQRYHCADCGKWFTSKKSILLADTRGV